MRTIQIRIVAKILVNKIPKKIILKRVSRVEKLLTRKIKKKYLSIKIRIKKILPLKIYLRSNVLITKN